MLIEEMIVSAAKRCGDYNADGSNDDDKYDRVKVADWVEYYNSAQVQLVTVRPDAHYKTAVWQMGANNVRQTTPSDCFQLIGIDRNMGSTGLVAGDVIRETAKEVLEDYDASWNTSTEIEDVALYAYSKRNPDNYWVYPRPYALARYDNNSMSVAAEDVLPSGHFIFSDGLKVWVVGASSTKVHEYSLATAWDLGTKTFVCSFDISAQVTQPSDIDVSPDGSKMYILSVSGPGTTARVFQYSILTPGDLSTAVYSGKVLDISGQDAYPVGFKIGPAGDNMYIGGATNLKICQYTFLTSYDMATASYATKFLDVSGQDAIPGAVALDATGARMYMGGSGNSKVYQYAMSTPLDIDTASYSDKCFDVSAEDTGPQGVSFNTDGSKMFVLCATGDHIYRYTLSALFEATSSLAPYVEGSYSYHFTDAVYATIGAVSVEADRQYHSALIDWMLREAYNVDTDASSNMGLSQKHEQSFYQTLGIEFKATSVISKKERR